MIARLKLMWCALTWPKERFYNMIELTYAGKFNEDTSRFEDTGSQAIRREGMVLVTYLIEEDGQALIVHEPFRDLRVGEDLV